MKRGILYVETYALPGEVEAYHRWYDEVHLVDFVSGVDGIVSARRFEPADEGAPFVTVYELEADDLEEVRGRMMAWHQEHRSDPVGVDAARPGVTRLYHLRTTFP
jgi:hypothetical protein